MGEVIVNQIATQVNARLFGCGVMEKQGGKGCSAEKRAEAGPRAACEVFLRPWSFELRFIGWIDAN